VLGSTTHSDGKKTEAQEGLLVRSVTASATKGRTLTVSVQDAYPMKASLKSGKLEKQAVQLFGHCAESNQFI